MPLDLSGKRQKGLDSKIQNLNHVITQLNDIDFYLYYIEKDEDVNFKTNNTKSKLYEYMTKRLNKKINTRKFATDNIDMYKDLFYQTDHHWNHKGAYKAYSDIVGWMNLGEPIKKGDVICTDATYRGSRAINLGAYWLFKEPFCVYSFEFLPHNITINRKDPTLTQYSKYPDESHLGYGLYYGDDVGLIEYDFFQEDKENLLIIGNSYDNAINELLASHFNHTYNVDLRHYEDDLNESFDIYRFVKDYNIDKILLIGNYGVYTDDTFNLKGGN